MPYKANEPRRHRIPRARYRVSNWPEYDRALQQRGSLTVWVTPEALAAWHPPKTGRRGRSCTYSDIAIETGTRAAWVGRRRLAMAGARSGKPPCSATKPSSVGGRGSNQGNTKNEKSLCHQ